MYIGLQGDEGLRHIGRHPGCAIPKIPAEICHGLHAGADYLKRGLSEAKALVA